MWGSSSRANDVTNCCSWASVASSSATIARAHARPSAATLGSYTLRADASNVSAVSPCRNSVRTARSASSSGGTPSLAAPAAMALAACPCRNPRTRPMSEGTRDTAAVTNPAIGAARSGCAAETTAPPAARTPSMSASAAEDPVPSLFVTSAQSGSPVRAPVLAATLSAHGSATLGDHRPAVLHEHPASDVSDEASGVDRWNLRNALRGRGALGVS